MSKFYVTTPIYYVNDKPHIGHAYTTLAADVSARYRRSIGDDVFFLTGVDEHGQKVEKAARTLGIEPQAHCDAMAPRFSDLWQRLGITPSAFLRTTDRPHQEVVRDALTRLYQKELIVQREFEGWYCVGCERYWTEKDLVDSACPDCRRKVEILKEKNYFFLMSRFRERIHAAIESEEMLILPKSRRNEVLGFLDQGIGDLCISRPKRRLGWGIPIPFDDEYVTYVWFDALINYISGPKYLADNGDWWPASAHLIGKDILTTHAVYWPAMLMALELPLPRTIVAHGWWNFSGEKMSKSVGNVVDPAELIENYSGDRAAVDAFRWFLLAEVPFGSDGNFSLDAFERRWTSDLSNDIGNLVSRVVALVEKVAGGSVETQFDDGGRTQGWKDALENFQFARAAEIIVSIARDTNQYVQARAPWSDKENAPETLSRACGAIGVLSAMLAPFIPDSADEIARRLGFQKAPSIAQALSGFTATVFQGDAIFKRPERKIAEEKKVFATIDDVKKLGLRIGVVKTAERVEKTEKLLKLTVDIGGEERTLIAGIAKVYAPEDLLGKRVVVVTNLEPAKIRGIESRGMILAAASDDSLSLIGPLLDMPAGSEVR